MQAKTVILSIAVLLLGRFLYKRATRSKLEAGAVALITGGGAGLGLELAKIFAEAGCKVVMVGRNEEVLRGGQAACVSAGAKESNYIVADLCTDAGMKAVAVRVAELHPEGVKYLILNAGAGAIAPFSSEPRFDAICHQMMDINYFANVHLLQAFMAQLTANHSKVSPSRVIVISSLAGVLPSILRSAYTASKHAIQGFMNALRGETDIAITLCCPGYVDTDFHQRVMTSDGKPLPGHQRRGVPPAQCARECVNSALAGDAEIIMSLSGKLGYHLRPFLTSVVDRMAKKKSLDSLKH